MVGVTITGVKFTLMIKQEETVILIWFQRWAPSSPVLEKMDSSLLTLQIRTHWPKHYHQYDQYEWIFWKNQYRIQGLEIMDGACGQIYGLTKEISMRPAYRCSNSEALTNSTPSLLS